MALDTPLHLHCILKSIDACSGVRVGQNAFDKILTRLYDQILVCIDAGVWPSDLVRWLQVVSDFVRTVAGSNPSSD